MAGKMKKPVSKGSSSASRTIPSGSQPQQRKAMGKPQTAKFARKNKGIEKPEEEDEESMSSEQEEQQTTTKKKSSVAVPASENKWRKLATAAKTGKNVKEAMDESEEEERIPTSKKSAKVVSNQKGSSKKQLMEDSESEEDEELVAPAKRKAALNTKAESSSDGEDDDDDDEEEDEEDGDEQDEDEDDDEDTDEFGGISKKSAKPQIKRKFLEDDDDEDEEDEEDIRLTHMGEEVEDDQAEMEGLDEQEEDEEAEGEDGAEEEEEAAEDDEAQLTPQELGVRIKETAAALSDFKAYRKRTKSQVSRSQLVTRLSKDCAAYYGYIPDLIELFLTLFGPTEMVEFLEANETPRPTCIRANTLKTTRRELAKALTARGVGLEPVADWTNVGLKIFESQIPIGATPEYLAGHYMIQSPSSLAPVMALDPRPGEKILDMCAAPGGKTSHIAQLMRNEGLLVASDAKLPRMDALVANLARMGVKIAACVHQDGRDYPKVLGGFDRILLDAPCSGLGVISHDPSVKQSRTLQDIQSTSNLQRELLLAAIDSVDSKSKEGGIIVYSTCSISVQENEQVVQYALEKRDVVLVECGFEFGKPGLTRWQGKLFHPNMKLCKRLYPHTHNMDGFFIAKLRKRSNAILEGGKPVVKKAEKEGEEHAKTRKTVNGEDASEGSEDETESVDSDEIRARQKQSEAAKRKNEKLKKKFGAFAPPQQNSGGGKKRPGAPQHGQGQKKHKHGGGGGGSEPKKTFKKNPKKGKAGR